MDFFFLAGRLGFRPLASRSPSRRPGFFADEEESDRPADPEEELWAADWDLVCPDTVRPQFGQFRSFALIRVPQDEQFMALLSANPRF